LKTERDDAIRLYRSQAIWKNVEQRLLDDGLESASTELNQTRRLSFCLSMIFSENQFPFFGIMLWQAVEKVSNRHSGRNEGANPESSHTDFLRISGFRIAACAASGMTTEILQQPASGIAL
jgi:hypothetical protein